MRLGRLYLGFELLCLSGIFSEDCCYLLFFAPDDRICMPYSKCNYLRKYLHFRKYGYVTCPSSRGEMEDVPGPLRPPTPPHHPPNLQVTRCSAVSTVSNLLLPLIHFREIIRPSALRVRVVLIQFSRWGRIVLHAGRVDCIVTLIETYRLVTR